MQDTCRALRPIVGNTADKLWQAYLFSDFESKIDIEQQIQLLAGAHLQQDVENTTPVFPPPAEHHADGSVRLGKVLYNEKALYPFGLRRSELIQHTAIVGRSGSGKSNVGFLMAESLLKENIPWLVLDWKRGWRDLMAKPGFENLRVYTVGRDVAPFRINPLIPPPGADPKNWIKVLVETIGKAYFCGEGVMYLLTTIIDELYAEKGIYDGTVTSYPTFQEVFKRVKNLRAGGREGLWQSSAMRAVHSLCFGAMNGILNETDNNDIGKYLDGPVVMELESLGHADKLFITQILMLEVYMHRLVANKREDIQHVLIIEEAHHLLSNLRNRGGEPASIVEVIFREIRELSEGIVFLDQMPSEISRTALANTYTSITLGLKGRADVATMAGAMLLDRDQERYLGVMPLGKAVVKLQGRSPDPFLVSIPEFSIKKGTVTDGQISEVMVDHVDHALPALSLPDLNNNEVLFLKDVALVPESGVSARYNRLKLSGRQGDKTKQALLSKSLVEEQEIIGKTGRSKVIRLSDKGKELFSTLPPD